MVQSNKDLQWRLATVVADTDEPQSFIVQDTFGTRHRRNHKFLKMLPPGTPEEVSTKMHVVNNAAKANMPTRMQDINVWNDKHN